MRFVLPHSTLRGVLAFQPGAKISMRFCVEVDVAAIFAYADAKLR